MPLVKKKVIMDEQSFFIPLVKNEVNQLHIVGKELSYNGQINKLEKSLVWQF